MKITDPASIGIDPERLERFFEVVERKVAEGELFGGAFLIARRGQIAAARGVGHVDRDRRRAARADDVYLLFSTSKPITATVLLRKVDRGDVRLIDRVADVIPEFAAAGKERVTIAHVLTHTAGFPNLPPDWLLSSWGDWDATIARICAQPLEHAPGEAVHYHALTGSWILGEIARRVEGGRRSFAELSAEELFQPLGMKDTHVGVRPDMRERRVPLTTIDKGGVPFPMEFLEEFNRPEIQTAAIPGGGIYSTVHDVGRFHQMWLNGGELDGARILSPAMVELATTIHTGDLADRLFEPLRMTTGWPVSPANRGLGFWLRGSGIHPSVFGSLASPRTFGHPGASSTMAWADPERDLVFVGLTSGLIQEARNIPRWHLFSDLAQATVVD
ncbi:MAG: hypothetical protein QOD06_12 [Candidatus Binatota bacterium]|nr:hypothetical protein [Candidatus Binatota bacterium]